jgi:polyhydroxybutyrate depolymerase
MSAGTGPVSAGAGSVAGGPVVGTAGAQSAGGAAGAVAAGGSSGGTSSSVAGSAGTFIQAGGAASGGAANGGAGGSGPVVCPATVTIKAGDNNQMLTIGTLQRTYLVHAPPGYTGKTAVPVVFDFHGLSGNGAQQKSLSRWDKVGDAEGFIMVYPDGVDKAWNAGLCCANDTTIDDVAFVRAIIKALQASACIDPKRIYATGCSNGGGMSYKLACEAADVIAAVAPVDFDCVDGSSCSMCKPTRPITEVQFRGTSDQLVAYDGSGAFMGAKKNFAFWGNLNMCTGSSGPLSSNAACETYPMCSGGTETVLCTVQNGMHCGNYSTFMIPEVAWGVLKNEALP